MTDDDRLSDQQRGMAQRLVDEGLIPATADDIAFMRASCGPDVRHFSEAEREATVLGISARLSAADATEQARARIGNALQITDIDTLGRIGANQRVVWRAEGSWSGSQNITIGDIRALFTATKRGQADDLARALALLRETLDALEADTPDRYQGFIGDIRQFLDAYPLVGADSGMPQ